MKISKKDLEKMRTDDSGVTVAYTGKVTFYKQDPNNDTKTVMFTEEEVYGENNEFNESQLNECINKYNNGNYDLCGDFGFINCDNGDIVFFILDDGNDEYYPLPSTKYSFFDDDK